MTVSPTASLRRESASCATADISAPCAERKSSSISASASSPDLIASIASWIAPIGFLLELTRLGSDPGDPENQTSSDSSISLFVNDSPSSGSSLGARGSERA